MNNDTESLSHARAVLVAQLVHAIETARTHYDVFSLRHPWESRHDSSELTASSADNDDEDAASLDDVVGGETRLQNSLLDRQPFSEPVLRMRYRNMCLCLHPDKQSEPNQAVVNCQQLEGPCADYKTRVSAAFHKTQEAFHVLSNAAHRELYDAGLRATSGGRLQASAEVLGAIRERAAATAALMMLFSAGNHSSAQQPQEIRCAQTGCRAVVASTGARCDRCLRLAAAAPLPSQLSKCSTFGCLRKASGAQLLCEICKNGRPVKCSVFGCLVSVRGGGEGAKCAKHSASESVGAQQVPKQ